jgi:hypothetical protein
MADIDVVKKGSRAWVWIVMIAILALVVWFIMAGNRPRTVGQLEIGGQPHFAAAVSASALMPFARLL